MIRSNENTLPIKQVIDQWLSKSTLKNKFDETHLINHWEEKVGKLVARHTTRLFFNHHQLFVEFDSPTVRHSFFIEKQRIVALFQQEFGADIITDIVIL